MKKLLAVLLVLVLGLTLVNINTFAKSKKVKLDKSKITLNCGSTKTLTLKNVRKKVNWKVSEKDKISIIKKTGKYKNKIKIKAKKSGSATVIGSYKKKKYKCKIIIKTSSKNSNNSNKNNLLDSVFQYDKAFHINFSLMNRSSEYKLISTKTLSGKLFLTIPKEAQNIFINKKSLNYSIKNEVIDMSVEYKIINDINSVADCERKINSIVKQIPNTLDENYIKHDEEHSKYVKGVLDDIDRYLYDKTKAAYLENLNLDSVWYTELNQNGCSYFLEESSRDIDSLVKYKNMLAEEYSYIDGICLYLKLEVNYFNYIDIYNSFDTVTERNEFENKYSYGYLPEYFDDMISDCFIKDNNGETKPAYIIYPGFRGLNLKTKLIK